MHRLFRFCSISLAALLLSSLCFFPAAAADLPDTPDHWANDAFERAKSDGLIADEPSNPDEPVTAAALAGILSRALGAKSASGDKAELGGVESSAVRLILSRSLPADPGRPALRSRAFAMLAEAFQLVSADQDASVLASFSDADTLCGNPRLAAAALAASGYIIGSGGALRTSDEMTLGEFLTALYRIAPRRWSPDAAGVEGFAVVSGPSSSAVEDFQGKLFFDCSTSEISLRNVRSSLVVLRSARLTRLALSSCEIGRLVFAAASGDISFAPERTNTISTVVIGDGGGKILLEGGAGAVEVTGDDREIAISRPVKSLVVSGSGNRISILPGARVDSVKVLPSASGNALTVDGSVFSCEIRGAGTLIEGSGSVGEMSDYSSSSTTAVRVERSETEGGCCLRGVRLELNSPDSLSPYSMLRASVSISFSSPLPESCRAACRGVWYLDDAYLSKSNVIPGETTSVSLSCDIGRLASPPRTAALSFVLCCECSGGTCSEIRIERSIFIESAEKYGARDILGLVTTGYKGNYSLEWALSHDYTAALKEAWVNAKGYSSKTPFLVWVSIAYQRVNVFSGSAGSWKLEKSFVVGTGAAGSETPSGVFKIIGKNPAGWTTRQYTVKPVVNFYKSYYGFHSRLYRPGTTSIKDPRIGFPVSHGCIRMYDDDIAWMYDNVPVGTTVVVF